MGIGGAEWLLELILLGLLAATLVHAMRLERALGVLKRDRGQLETLVKGFNDSTRQAEAGIERLRGAADSTGRHIARQIEAAASLKEDLGMLIERGVRLADQMEGLVRVGRHVEPFTDPPFAHQPGTRQFIAPIKDDVNGNVRVRSQAERDLLHALRVVPAGRA
jgi:hypothetical protein